MQKRLYLYQLECYSIKNIKIIAILIFTIRCWTLIVSLNIKFKLEKDDVIVMVSDGIAQTLEDSAWLADIIIGEWDENLKSLFFLI